MLDTLKKPGRAVRDSVKKSYDNFIMSWPIWFGVINGRAHRLFVQHPPALTDVQKRIIADLKQNGIAFTHIDELFPGQDLLPKLEAYAKELRPYAEQVTNKKPFILEHWEAFPTFSLKNPFIPYSLSPEILNVVNSYMDMWSKFYYFMLGLAIPRGEAPQASQRWHRDFEEIKMCKVFLYMNDVTEENGPFIYVPGSQLGGKWRQVFPPYAGYGSYPPEGEVEKAIPASEIKVCTAPKGTIIFADTTGLHKGGYARNGERLMYTAGYNSNAALGRRRYYLTSGEDLSSLTPEARYSLRAIAK